MCFRESLCSLAIQKYIHLSLIFIVTFTLPQHVISSYLLPVLFITFPYAIWNNTISRSIILAEEVVKV